MTSRLSATRAARSFSEVLNRVQYRREEFVIERGGHAICRISPVAPVGRTASEVAELLRGLAGPGADYAADVESAMASQPLLGTEDPWQP